MALTKIKSTGIDTSNLNLTVSSITANGSLGSAGQVLSTNGTAVYWDTAAGGGVSAGGTDTQIQFNDGGSSLNATAGFTFSKTTNNVTVSNNVIVGSSVNAASYTVGSAFIANSTAIVGTGYANLATSVNSALLTVGTAFIANTIGAFHTGVVNAASHTTTNFIANNSGSYPLSNSAGTDLGATTQRWVLNANTINASGLITGSAGATITGQSNLADVIISGNLTVSGTTTYINTTTLNVGDNIVVLNADITNVTAPTENAGLEINRGSSANVNFLWNETSDSWTAGNTDITGYANASVSVNSALLTVGTAFIANSTAIVGTGYANISTSVNSALLTVGSAFIANATGVYHTGIVNAATLSVGSNFIANATQLTVTKPFSANGGTGTSGQVLTSNGSTGSPYWSTVSSSTATIDPFMLMGA